MVKQTTRDAALSRLFGNPSDPDEGESKEAAGLVAPPEDEADRPVEDQARPTEGSAHGAPKRRGGGGATAGGSEREPPKDEPAPSGYIGLGRYSRSDGIVERITPYVRPDQAEALRIAVARKNDPRGTDVSQIIQSLLDEAGYRS